MAISVCPRFEKMARLSRIALGSNRGPPETDARFILSLYLRGHRCFRVKVLEPGDPGPKPGAAAY